MMEYSKYRDSGIPWIGKIPAHWNILRGKNILMLLERPVQEGDDIITCFRDGEVTLRKNRREEGFTVSMKEIGYQGVEPGDLVVHGMDGFAGAIGVSDSRGKATPVLNVMDSKENKRYLMYYLRAAAYKDVFMSLSTGIRVRSCDLRWNKLSVFPFLIPDINEQDSIVTYIDSQIKRVDDIISKAKASIEEYKSWKASIIYEAVTKGLDPNVEMKDSGVEWIGKIPSNWTTKSIKYIMQESKERTATGTEEMLSVTQKYGIIKSSDATISNPSTSTEDWRIVHIGDIVFNKYKAHSGVFFVSPLEGIVTFNYCVYRCFPDNCAKYFEYQFKTPRCIGEFITHMKGVGDSISPLYTTELYKIKIIVPPIEEQLRIVEYLNIQCPKIDEIISEKESLVADLESYKKSLIFEVVTGKRRVV